MNNQWKQLYRVLVADDDAIVGSILKTTLIRDGFDVEVFTEAPEFQERLKTQDFALVIADLAFPGFPAPEILTQLKQSYPLAELVLLASHTSRYHALQWVQQGAYDIVAKPFDDLEVLPIVVTRAFEKVALKIEIERLKGELKKRDRQITELQNSLAARHGQTTLFE